MDLRGASLVVCATLLVAACGGPAGRRLTASEYLAEQARDDAAAYPTFGRAPDEDEAYSAGSSSASRIPDAPAPFVTRAELEFQLAERLAQREWMSLEHAAAVDEAALERTQAERALRRAAEDLEHFKTVEVEHLLQEDRLRLAEERDVVAGLSDELAELERLYGGDSGIPGASTAIGRGRRALETAREHLALLESRSLDLRERSLPRRIEDLAAAVDAAQVAWQSLQRRHEADELQRVAERARWARDEAALRARLEVLGAGSRAPAGAERTPQ